MKTIRCLIVDDEPLARERVREFLSGEPDVEIIAETADGAATLDAIEEHRPDLLFLDIQIPRLNGFEVLESIAPEKMPAVIFTTAYDTHAVKAFEASAVDYLLKPFKPARFKESVARARSRFCSDQTTIPDPKVAQLLAQLRSVDGGPRILVRSAERIIFVRAKEVDFVESAGNYLVLHCGAERHIVRETMAMMAEKLESAGFMRISRSSIVNLTRIRELQTIGPGHYCVILKSGTRLDMSTPLRDLQERMGAA